MQNLQQFSTATPHPAEVGLPTLDKLGNPTVPDEVDVHRISEAWLETFGTAASAGDVDGVLALLVPSSYKTNL